MATTESTRAHSQLRIDQAGRKGRPGNSDAFLTWFIVLLAPIGQMAIDIYVPSLPLLVRTFDTAQGTIQLSITLYLLSFAIGQLLYGPLSDSYGRKKALLLGISVYLAGSVLSLTADSIWVFIAARLIQGLGITTASVVMKTIATDRFSGAKLGTVMTYMVVSWGLGPIVAPVIGAWFQVSFDWRYSLYFLLAYGVLLLGLVGLVYQETNTDLRPLRVTDLARNAKTVLRDGVFTRVYLSMGLSYAILLTFNLIGPFLVQDVLGRSPGTYGAIALAMGCAFFLGVFSNRLLPASVTLQKKFQLASAAGTATSAAMVVLALATSPNLWVLTVPSMVIVLFAGVMYPNLTIAAISRFPQISGLASSLLGFLLAVCSSLVMLVSALFKADSLVPMSILFFACMLVCRLLVMRIVPRVPEN